MQVIAKLVKSEVLHSTKTGKSYTLNTFHNDDDMCYIKTFGTLPMTITPGDTCLITFGVRWENNQIYPKNYELYA
jgi:hypothetical protein